MSEKIRDEFEAWAKSEQISIEVFAEDEQNAGEYYFLEAHCAWKAWQASRAALRVELPENCKGMTLTVTEFHKQLDEAGVSYK